MRVEVSPTFSAPIVPDALVPAVNSVSYDVPWTAHSFNLEILNYLSQPAVRPNEQILSPGNPVVAVYFQLIFSLRVLWSIPIQFARQSIVVPPEISALLRQAENVRSVAVSPPPIQVKVIAPQNTRLFLSIGQVRYIYNGQGQNRWVSG